jgi:hypothetical protein
VAEASITSTGELAHRRLPDLAVDAHHEHGLARFGDAGAAQAFHRGDERHADAGGLLPGNAGGFLHDSLGFDHEMRGVGAVAANAEIAGGAEHLAPDPSRRPADHDARIVAPRCAWKYRIGHQPGRGLDVGRIDRRGPDLDQQVVVAARQRVGLDIG